MSLVGAFSVIVQLHRLIDLQHYYQLQESHSAFQEDVEAEHPLLPRDLGVVDLVEVFEDLLADDAVRHVEARVEELLEHPPGHPVPAPALLLLNTHPHTAHSRRASDVCKLLS